jgi:radical SAM superfamily enzyme YgiQ (UPF0313 family)
MKVKIIQPFISAQALFTHRLAGMARFSTQLGPLAVAALTPDDFKVEVINEQIEDIDYEAGVDIVGISTLTANITHGYEIADRFRQRGVTVVMGGIHASFMPEEAIDHCDAVVMGEAEYAWPQLLNDWEKGELKQFYRSDKLSDMADIPIPRRDLDLTVGYTDKVEFSRGCPFDCDFCSTNLHFGSKHRTRPIPNLIDDINSIYRTPVHGLMFTDDNIVGSPKYAMELFAAIEPLNVNWVSQCALNIADNDKLLKSVEKSGCKALSVGFETLSETNLKESRKLHNKVRKYDEQIKRLKDAGIVLLANFVFGFDDDDKSVFETTAEFVLRHEMEAYFTILTPYPRTRLRERLLEEGRILHSDWSLYDTTHCVIKPKLMEPEELEEGLRWAYQQIYSGKELMLKDPKALHSEYRLSKMSEFLLQIGRQIEDNHGSAEGVKRLFIDAILNLDLRAQVLQNVEEAVKNGAYEINDDEMKMLKQIIQSTEHLDNLMALEKELIPENLKEYEEMGYFV